jgi:hypothetical protein
MSRRLNHLGDHFTSSGESGQRVAGRVIGVFALTVAVRWH